MIQLLQHALKEDEVLKQKKIELKETSALINISGGDARKLLNLLELVAEASLSGGGLEGAVITDDKVMDIAQKKNCPV